MFKILQIEIRDQGKGKGKSKTKTSYADPDLYKSSRIRNRMERYKSGSGTNIPRQKIKLVQLGLLSAEI